MRVYSIEPGKLREMQDPDSGTSLKTDGSNATSVLKEIGRQSERDFRRISDILATIVLNTTGVQVKKHGKKLSLEFTQEWGEKKRPRFEGFSMSDGTLRAIGLLAAVFQRPVPSLIAVEEPIFNAYDNCPKQLAPTVEDWAREAAPGKSCAVVMANREYEAWSLGSVESLRGKAAILPNAAPHPNPQASRDAKGALELMMLPGATYSPTVDQATLTAHLDLETAYRRCRSFRKLVGAFGFLATAAGMAPADWPPAAWARNLRSLDRDRAARNHDYTRRRDRP